MIISIIKKYQFQLLSILGFGIIITMLALMINTNLKQSDDHIDYAPKFPVYRSSDTTELNLLKNELIDSGENTAKIQRSMEGTNMSLIQSTIAIIAALLLNPLLFKALSQIKALGNKIDTNDTTNKEDHAMIHKELKSFKSENKIQANLDEITSHYLEIAPKEISTFVAHEGRRITYFAELVMNSKFDRSILPSFKVKLDVAKSEAKNEIKDFPSLFKTRFAVLQNKGVDKLYNSLSDIVYDEVRNSKDTRFRMICEQFLENHLGSLLAIYDDVTKLHTPNGNIKQD